jgi:hypothetical protein
MFDNRQAFIEFISPPAATAAKHKIDSFSTGQSKKHTVTYTNPLTNPFRTLPKDTPSRGKEGSRSNSASNFNSPSTGPPAQMNFGMNNMGGGYNNRGGRGGYNNRGGMNNMNYNQNRSYSGPMGGGFQGNPMGGGFQGGPMGAMPPYGGGFQNRGGMMGNMRGGGGMRGGRGGMGGPSGMMPMGGMPAGMPGMPNPMGGMGMGNMGGGMGMQGMTGFRQYQPTNPTHPLPGSYMRPAPMGQMQPLVYRANSLPPVGAVPMNMPMPVPAAGRPQGQVPAYYPQSQIPGPAPSTQAQVLSSHQPQPLESPNSRQSSTPLSPYYTLSPNPIPDRYSPEKQQQQLKRDHSGQPGFGGAPHFNPAFFQGGGAGGQVGGVGGGEGNWNPHGAKRTRQE